MQELIEKLKVLKKPTLIAISGFGGSGKTRLAEELHKALPSSVVVHLDDFIVKEKLTEPSWDRGAFDQERLEQQVLLPLSQKQKAKFQKLIWETNTLSDFQVLPSADYVIVEGISSYHPDIAKYYDFKIWVNTPMELAKQRGHARDGSNENAANWDLWAYNDLDYQTKYQPVQTADFVFHNLEAKDIS